VISTKTLKEWQSKCEWMYSKCTEHLCRAEKGLIWLNPVSGRVFSLCRPFLDPGLSCHSPYKLLGLTATHTYQWLVTSMPQCCWLASIDRNHYRNELNNISDSLIIWAEFCRVHIADDELHNSRTWSYIAASMPFAITNLSTFNPDIMNWQHTPCVWLWPM